MLSKPLDKLHARIGCGEAALLWLLMKDSSEEVPTKTLEDWMGEERFPGGWNPKKVIGLIETRKKAQEVVKMMIEFSSKED
jgi:hypothetical protein